MTSYVWILLLLASLAATRAQDFDLSDAFDQEEKPPVKVTQKPPPPKNADPGFDLSDAFDFDPKKPDVVSPKTDDKKKPFGDDLDLFDALHPDTEPKKPYIPPKERGTADCEVTLTLVTEEVPVTSQNQTTKGGGSFDDKDLFDVNAGGEYKPDEGRGGGGARGGDPEYNDQSGGASEQPQGGALAAIISSVGVALLGAASSYFAYQKKKLCFRAQGGEDPESGKNRGNRSDLQVLSNLLRTS